MKITGTQNPSRWLGGAAQTPGRTELQHTPGVEEAALPSDRPAFTAIEPGEAVRGGGGGNKNTQDTAEEWVKNRAKFWKKGYIVSERNCLESYDSTAHDQILYSLTWVWYVFLKAICSDWLRSIVT